MAEISPQKSGLKPQSDFRWSMQQMLGLAPDTITVKATSRLIDLVRWGHLGQTDDVIWGLFNRPSLPPHQIFVRKNDLTGSCSCLAIKHPCKFFIAMLALFASQPELFERGNPPDWVSDPLTTADSHLQPHDPYPQLIETQASMAEFGRWLRDQVSQGISDFASRQPDLEAMANRLIDGHMPRLAEDLRALGKRVAPAKGNPPADWPQVLVSELGRFYLLTQAWARFDQLSEAEQGDLILAGGGLTLAVHGPSVADHWLVFGRRFEQIGRKWQRRTWLWGTQSGRFAQLSGQMSGRNLLIPHLVTGEIYSGSVEFFATTAQFSGKFHRVGVEGVEGVGEQLLSPEPSGFRPLRPPQQMPADFDILEKQLIKAQTQNPWLRRWPVRLHGVHLQFDTAAKQWLLVDAQQRSVPVQNGSVTGWQLLASNHGRPIDLFGEWAAEGLTLISVFYDDQWQDLSVWGSKA